MKIFFNIDTNQFQTRITFYHVMVGRELHDVGFKAEVYVFKHKDAKCEVLVSLTDSLHGSELEIASKFLAFVASICKVLDNLTEKRALTIDQIIALARAMDVEAVQS